jgi:hypothetical protein
MFDCYICKNILIEPYLCSKCETRFCNNCLDNYIKECGNNKCPKENCDNSNFLQDVNLETELYKKSDLKCNKCNKTLKNYDLYKIHDCFQCSLCEQKFKKDEKSFFNHLKEKHYEQIIKESKKN